MRRSRERCRTALPGRDVVFVPETDAQVAAATAYEDVFVPASFEPWTPRVADAAGLAPGLRVRSRRISLKVVEPR